MSTLSVSNQARVYKRDWKVGLTGLVRWMVNPVSADGALALTRAGLALGGPDAAAHVANMARDVVGRRVLDDRPDLGAYLADMETLGSMPEGSFGQTYHAFMDRPEVVPTALLATGLYRTGQFEALDWDDDMVFLTERMAYTHDLIHVLSGYGTSLPAEAINIGFTIGIEARPHGRALSEAFASFTGALFCPTIGVRRWRSLVIEAFERGNAAAGMRPLYMLYFEELFPMPLDEARRTAGVPERRAPETPTEDWIRNPVGKAMAHGYGSATVPKDDPLVRAAFALAHSGMPARRLASITDDQWTILAEIAGRHGTATELLATLN